MESITRVIGNQILDWEQCQGLINNKRNLLMGRQVVRDAVMVRDVSWEEAEDFYNNLSTPDRAMVRKSGQQGICGEGENTLGWYDPDTDALTKNPTHGRGILICQLYLNQGGRCAYTQTGPYNILDFQVEHIIANGGDHPDNWFLVAYNVNENRKQSRMTKFINRWEKRAANGQEEFEKWYNDLKKAANKGQRAKVTILSMEEDDLRDYLDICPAKYEKYMWRNIGMSSLQPFRLTKAGVARPGGSQGNYKEVLNTVLNEYLRGDKELARQIYRVIRIGAAKYVNGEINNTDYVEIMCEMIELSNHQAVKYNREKFTAKVLRNTYSWPNLKK